MMLWHIYDTFERALDRYASHPALEPTYNPTLLARAPALAADISFFLQVPETSWKSHPLHQDLLAEMPPPLATYVSRIRDLADSDDPSPLLAHSYVRYLGDLSGGQTLRRIIGKAYDLDEASGLGLEFFTFKELRSNKLASQGELKRIKEWFREGMNTAGKLGIETKEKVMEEANLAFALNTELFSVLIHLIPAAEELANGQDNVTDSEYKPFGSETTYPLSQVIAVIAAICMAHFVLVTGGFTGERGYQKLLSIEHWFDSFWESSA